MLWVCIWSYGNGKTGGGRSEPTGVPGAAVVRAALSRQLELELRAAPRSLAGASRAAAALGERLRALAGSSAALLASDAARATARWLAVVTRCGATSRYDMSGVGGAVAGKLGSLCGCSDATGDSDMLGGGSGSTISTSGPDPESWSDPS